MWVCMHIEADQGLMLLPLCRPGLRLTADGQHAFLGWVWAAEGNFPTYPVIWTIDWGAHGQLL